MSRRAPSSSPPMPAALVVAGGCEAERPSGLERDRSATDVFNQERKIGQILASTERTHNYDMEVRLENKQVPAVQGRSRLHDQRGRAALLPTSARRRRRTWMGPRRRGRQWNVGYVEARRRRQELSRCKDHLTGTIAAIAVNSDRRRSPKPGPNAHRGRVVTDRFASRPATQARQLPRPSRALLRPAVTASTVLLERHPQLDGLRLRRMQR